MIVVNAGHAHRRAAGGYALADLVAGWALTAGPQQTLSSAGVVTSGPLDLTEELEDHTLNYDENGAGNAAGGADDVKFVDATGAAIGASKADAVLLSIECYIPDAGGDPAAFPRIQTFTDGTFGWPYQLAGSPLSYSLQDDNGHVSRTLSDDLLVAGHNALLGWFDPGTGDVNWQANGGTVASTNVADDLGEPDWTLTRGPVTLYIRPTNLSAGANRVRNVRLWIGPNAATLAGDATFRSWLANSGAGRTDAELAAYTP